MTHVLEVRNLQLNIGLFEGTARVLDGINLTVDEKETLSLIGESGCGKSMTAQSVLGVLPPQAKVVSGEVIFNGRNILVMNEKERHRWVNRQMAFVPQYPMTSLNPSFTVGEQMLDLIRYAGMESMPLGAYLSNSREGDPAARRNAIDMLQKVDVPSPELILKRYPFELSGGMRQRVLIAMALALDPVLLIADEPGSAVDVTIQDKINRLIKDIVKEKGLSLLYITHNLGIARMISQRICIMYGGCIVEAGDTKTVFSDPEHPYTIGLMNALPKLTGAEFSGIDGRIPDYVHPPEGCRFHPRCPHAMDVCIARKPELLPRHERSVACHLYN